jgi:hypothetical protein
MVGGGRGDKATGSSARKRQPPKKAKEAKVSVEMLDRRPGRNSAPGALLKSLVESRDIVGMTPRQVYDKWYTQFQCCELPKFRSALNREKTTGNAQLGALEAQGDDGKGVLTGFLT